MNIYNGEAYVLGAKVFKQQTNLIELELTQTLINQDGSHYNLSRTQYFLDDTTASTLVKLLQVEINK
jgi:hypothetical protein